MSLFSDGPMSSIEELRKYDSSILDVAGTEGIDLDFKLELSQREIGIELIAFLLSHAPEAGRRRDVSYIYVTEPLRHWHALSTLELSYLDAYNTQLNDRYRGKWKEYSKEARNASALLYNTGVGVVSSPIPKPGIPVCATIMAGSSPASVTYYVQIRWTNRSGFVGSPSESTSVTVPSAEVVTVKAPQPPSDVAGWVVYAGASDEALHLQNEAPLANDATWVMPSSGLINNIEDRPLQSPDYYVTRRHTMRRG